MSCEYPNVVLDRATVIGILGKSRSKPSGHRRNRRSRSVNARTAQSLLPELDIVYIQDATTLPKQTISFDLVGSLRVVSCVLSASRLPEMCAINGGVEVVPDSSHGRVQN